MRSLRLLLVVLPLLPPLALPALAQLPSEPVVLPDPEPELQPATPETSMRIPGRDVRELSGRLEPVYRTLLRDEMKAIETATTDLVRQLGRADAAGAAKSAHALQRGFGMDQKIASDLYQALTSVLPDTYLDRDRAYHETAEKLAKSLDGGDLAAAAPQLGELLLTCVRCHADYQHEAKP